MIEEAIKFINTGITNRLDSPDKTVSVYKVKNIIRVDIKDV